MGSVMCIRVRDESWEGGGPVCCGENLLGVGSGEAPGWIESFAILVVCHLFFLPHGFRRRGWRFVRLSLARVICVADMCFVRPRCRVPMSRLHALGLHHYISISCIIVPGRMRARFRAILWAASVTRMTKGAEHPIHVQFERKDYRSFWYMASSIVVIPSQRQTTPIIRCFV